MFQLINVILKMAEGKAVTVNAFGARRSLNRVIWTVLCAVLVAAIAAGAPFDY